MHHHSRATAQVPHLHAIGRRRKPGEIVTGAGPSKEDVAPPGTYTVSWDLADCYWEQTRKDGTIIDNQFATAARPITATVQAGQLFTSRDCRT